ncbi:MAG: 16S rRNA (cytidine(1402)-2'-O)-methyltransferase [Olegusella sp.]|nr:16S rRNA (cytidine(1402)-2'-O)-methyltransferase [Olegusella sp.]
MLSMVGTPIGNLSDASPRVIETLRDADAVLCEDTRVTGKLLAHFGIRTPLERADENVLASRIPGILERIGGGAHIAFVSDAGMPGVSDPGQRLVDAALDAGLPVEVIPGPSAVVCALVASGLPMERFFFEGFLPRKAGAQRERLAVLAAIPGALVIYESPRRVAATLGVVAEVMPVRQVALVRELTKLHEEVLRGTAAELAEQVSDLKGECVLVIAPPSKEELAPQVTAADLDDEIRAGLAAGESKSSLAKRLAKELSRPKSEIYDRILELS